MTITAPCFSGGLPRGFPLPQKKARPLFLPVWAAGCSGCKRRVTAIFKKERRQALPGGKRQPQSGTGPKTATS